MQLQKFIQILFQDPQSFFLFFLAKEGNLTYLKNHFFDLESFKA